MAGGRGGSATQCDGTCAARRARNKTKGGMKLKHLVTACERCGKRRRNRSYDSEYCPATAGLIPSAKQGTHVFGGHLWYRTSERIMRRR